jgi:hypothetical protein
MSNSASRRLEPPQPTSEGDMQKQRILKSIPGTGGSGSPSSSRDNPQGLTDEQLRYDIVGWDEA